MNSYIPEIVSGCAECRFHTTAFDDFPHTVQIGLGLVELILDEVEVGAV